jgi:hypothetical protein
MISAPDLMRVILDDGTGAFFECTGKRPVSRGIPAAFHAILRQLLKMVAARS